MFEKEFIMQAKNVNLFALRELIATPEEPLGMFRVRRPM